MEGPAVEIMLKNHPELGNSSDAVLEILKEANGETKLRFKNFQPNYVVEREGKIYFWGVNGQNGHVMVYQGGHGLEQGEYKSYNPQSSSGLERGELLVLWNLDDSYSLWGTAAQQAGLEGKRFKTKPIVVNRANFVVRHLDGSYELIGDLANKNGIENRRFYHFEMGSIVKNDQLVEILIFIDENNQIIVVPIIKENNFANQVFVGQKIANPEAAKDLRLQDLPDDLDWEAVRQVAKFDQQKAITLLKELLNSMYEQLWKISLRDGSFFQKDTIIGMMENNKKVFLGAVRQLDETRILWLVELFRGTRWEEMIFDILSAWQEENPSKEATAQDIAFKLTDEEKQRIIKSLHQRVSDSRPFEVELTYGQEKIMRLLRYTPDFFMINFKSTDRKAWNDVNERLKKLFIFTPSDINFFKSLLGEVSQNGLLLAWLMGLLAAITASRAMFKDQIVGTNAQKTIDPIWENNPWLSGDQNEIKEFLKQIMQPSARVLTEEEQRYIEEEIRPQLDDKGRAILDTILLITARVPHQAIRQKDKMALLHLIPFVSLALIKDPKAFSQRQAMDKELRELVEGITATTTVRDYYQGLQRIISKYGAQPSTDVIEGQPEQIAMPPFEELKFQVVSREQETRGEKVGLSEKAIHWDRHDGTISRQKGYGGDFEEYRPYRPGDDDPKWIDAKSTARMGKPMVKVYSAEKEVRAGLSIDLRLPTDNYNQWIEDLIKSLKALYKNNRAKSANSQEGDYALKQLIFIMPDGGMTVLNLEMMKGKLNYLQLLNYVMRIIEKQYPGIIERTPMRLQIQTPSFYESSWEGFIWLSRASLVKAPEGLSPEERERELRRAAKQIYVENIFVVGTEAKNQQEVLSLLRTKKRQVNFWDGNIAKDLSKVKSGGQGRATVGSVVHMSFEDENFGNDQSGGDVLAGYRGPRENADRSRDEAFEHNRQLKEIEEQARNAQPKDSAQTAPTNENLEKADNAFLGQVDQSAEHPGGIDLTRKRLNLQTQGEGVDFNLPFDPSHLDQIPINGLTPVIFQITPVTDLPLLLGLAEKHPEILSAAQ